MIPGNFIGYGATNSMQQFLFNLDNLGDRHMKRKSRQPSPVAKHNRRFNRAVVFRDRTAYRRKPKHKGREPFAIAA